MLQKGRRLSVYNRPSSELDILFEPDYIHNPNQATCENCDKSKVVDRDSRESDAPEIHYGLIASGDRVIKTAAGRNAISKDLGGVLCFEMEAAGPMAEFSCIVIRGISNYADSHKNDIWQYYAAAAAAGCAKELLSYLDSNRPPAMLLPVPVHEFDSPTNTGSTSNHGLRTQITSQRFWGSKHGLWKFVDWRGLYWTGLYR
jgi:hypothetical protein